MDADLPTAFAAAARAQGDRVALVQKDGTRVTFAALQGRVEALARAWRADGLERGDRVLVAMPVGADLYASLAAIWTLGATAVLPEPALGLFGLRHALRAAPVQAFCASGPYRALRAVLPSLWRARSLTPGRGQVGGEPVRAVCELDDTALVSFTSGSTGTPKAIARSHAFLMAQRAAVEPLLASDCDETDLVAFPVFVLLNLAAGRTSVLPNWRPSRAGRVAPAALRDLIERRGATRLLLPPALCETLVRAGVPPSVGTILTGGGPVFPDLVARLRERDRPLRIVSVYGSTEAEPIAEIDADDVTVADRAAMADGRGLLAGRPVPGLEVRIEADEILVSGAHVVTGYLDPARDGETKRRIDGRVWHLTGDAGRLDTAGRLWLLGRINARIDTESGPLWPFCVETAVRGWPGVRQAALSDVNGTPSLVVEGNVANLDVWQRLAALLGITHIVVLDRLPMDRRHGSKVDRNALLSLIRHRR